MYMQDGKPVIPYGRKTHGVNKIEFDDLLLKFQELEQRIAKLEAATVEAEPAKKRTGKDKGVEQ